MSNEKQVTIKSLLEKIIFGSKWILVPFFLKLLWTLLKLMYHFFNEGHLSNEDLMQTLEDVDIVMIACLVKMIITGSYHSFVSKTHGFDGEQVSSGALKIKMSTSIMGVSSIHLLKTFIDSQNIPMETIYKQLFIHGMFILGSIVFAYIDFMHVKSEKLEHEIPNHKPKKQEDEH